MIKRGSARDTIWPPHAIVAARGTPGPDMAEARVYPLHRDKERQPADRRAGAKQPGLY